MIYFYFPIKDTTIYEENTSKNTGKDEIIELTKITSGSTRRDDSGAIFSQTFNTRILTEFNYTDLSASIVDGTIPTFNTGSATSASAFMKFHVSQENAITDTETVNMLPLSMSGGRSWTEGLGRDKNLNEAGVAIAEQGASWTHSNLATSQTWGTLKDGTHTNNWATNSGGGTWHSNSAYLGSQDLSTTSGDLSLNITNGVGAHLDGTILNDGWITKRTDTNETNSGRFGSHKYFSLDTHTIYAPKLEVKWDDSIHTPGTLTELTDDDILVYPKNNRGEYKKDSRERIRVSGRERYPTKTYATSSDYSTTKYLPTTSYWGIKDMHTEEYVIDFDTTYTKISCDSTGNYFDFWMDGLQPERYYKFVFRIDRGTRKQYFDEDFAFKIVR
jgi:hypothetical protein